MKKAKFFVLYILIYIGFFLLFNELGFIPKQAEVNKNSTLPTEFIDGVVNWYPGLPRMGSSGITVKDREGSIHYMRCMRFDVEMFPGVVPCSRDAFNKIDGEHARVWYMKTSSKLFFLEEELLLVVQMNLSNGMIYPFDTFKNAAIYSHDERRRKYYLFLFLINVYLAVCIWFLFVAGFTKKFIDAEL